MKVHVTKLAKWKTGMQMVALAILLAGARGGKASPRHGGHRSGVPVARRHSYALDRL